MSQILLKLSSITLYIFTADDFNMRSEQFKVLI